MAQISGSTKKKTLFVHLEDDSGDMNGLHLVGIQGEIGQQPGERPLQGEDRQLAAFRPRNNSVSQASGPKKRSPGAFMSLGSLLLKSAGL